MSKVVVLGAGASGIIAALTASLNNEVILIDGNDKCGKKLLVTGNGKCNYWNEFINIENYYTDNYDILSKILEKKDEVLNYLNALGIYPKIKNNYYYPNSGLASSIREIFSREINKRNIKTLYNTLVKEIVKYNNQYIIKTINEEIICDKVIIATGSKAAPKTGSNGFSYEVAKKLGHTCNPVLPALTSLKSNEIVKEWTGVRCDATLKLIVNNELIKEESGEIQLTDDGISGICTFNLSSLVSKSLYKNKCVSMKINFVPNISNFKLFIEERSKILKNSTIEELLESILNYKLTSVILKKCNLKKEMYWHKLNMKEKELLIHNITNFELNITQVNSFDKAQVCTGGIPLNEVNENMESIYNKGIYLVGELLDVDGKCGGFNLAFAFITGYIAGKSIK